MSIKNSGRYTPSADESYEPGSHDEVLVNRLHIKTLDEIQALEDEALKRTELVLPGLYDKDHRFTAQDVSDMHQRWLGDIYYFAGKYRTVNLWKDNFAFAHIGRIQYLMMQWEQHYLAKYTPCRTKELDILANALAMVHVEFILIHPFRLGNGRIARVLANLMAFQANYPSLNYQSIDQTRNKAGFNEYILAIHAGAQANYYPMKKIFKKILMDSIG